MRDFITAGPSKIKLVDELFKIEENTLPLEVRRVHFLF